MVVAGIKNKKQARHCTDPRIGSSLKKLYFGNFVSVCVKSIMTLLCMQRYKFDLSNCFRLYDFCFLRLCLKELKGDFSFCRYEQAFLTTLLLEKKTNLWIGFNDMHQEGKFFWTDSSPTKYTNWNVNEPQNYGWRRDCVDMTPFGHAGRWGTVQCDQQKGFICETGL